MSTELVMTKGTRLISLNSSRINLPDDPSFPFKLEVNLRPPGAGGVAFAFICGGSEELIVCGRTKKALDKFIEVNELRTHPRLRRFTITGPDGVVEQFPEKSR